MTTKHTGGPAFPMVVTEYNPDSESMEATSPGGMTLRDYFIAHAPASEIETIIPVAIGDMLDFIGIRYGPQAALSTYRRAVHYPMALAKARLIWADAMLKAR